MKLVVLSGNQAGQMFEIMRDVVVIGRDTQCDMPIADIAASRNHCQIRRDPTGYVIQDLGSTNGTQVNGERIAGARALQPGDVITIGKTQLRLEESQTMPAFATVPPVAVPPPMVQPELKAGPSNGTWIAVGGILIVLLLIGIVAAVVMLMQPPAPTPTVVAVVPTTAPTLAPTPTIVPPTATLAPTPTAPATVISATIAPAVGNVESTRTPTPTPTNTPTFTPTPTNTPTNTPTRVYAAPVLSSPADKSKFSNYDTLVLQWLPIGNLREKDQYYLQVSTRGEFQNDMVCWAYTQNTQVTLSAEFCPNGMQFNARYFWRVGMVAPDANGKPTSIGPFSPVREFGWQP